MALEKWEVELRKQLDGTKKAAVKEEWEVQLEKEIINVAPKKKTFTAFFYVVIAILLGVLVYAYDMKTNAVSNWYNNCSVKKVDVAPQQVPVVKDDSSLRGLKADVDKLKADHEKLAATEKWNSDRITLIATVQQDNFLAVRNGNNNFIYFTSNWELEKMPQYLQLTDDDKAFLNKYLKK